MAIELLIRAVNNVNPNAIQEALWKQGEIVCIKASPTVWGALETLAGGFWRVTIEGLEITDPRILLLLEQYNDAIDETILRARRRRWIDINALPTRVRNALNSTGTVTVRTNELAGFDAATRVRT